MLGKEKCRMLREIRRRIADENDIPFVTKDCEFQGACRGTCPRCESELRYLEKQLAAREALGKRVAVAALCAGMAFSAAGCAPFGRETPEDLETDLTGAVADVDIIETTPEPDVEIETGEIAWPEDGDENDIGVETALTGDVAWEPGAENDG